MSFATIRRTLFTVHMWVGLILGILLAVLGTRTAALPGLLTFAHQLHGNFLLGRDGRGLVVGWLGVAMLTLGITGLVLWWPKKGQWKNAFLVRRAASGLRLHRELHAAT